MPTDASLGAIAVLAIQGLILLGYWAIRKKDSGRNGHTNGRAGYETTVSWREYFDRKFAEIRDKIDRIPR